MSKHGLRPGPRIGTNLNRTNAPSPVPPKVKAGLDESAVNVLIESGIVIELADLATINAATVPAGEVAFFLDESSNSLYRRLGASAATLLSGLGDVVGPALSTNDALVRYDGTTGKLVQDSVVRLTDVGIMSGLTGLDVAGTSPSARGDGSELIEFRDNRTTSGSAVNYVLAVNRQNSTTAAWYLGNDGDGNAVFVSNNRDTIFGTDLTGNFTERMRLSVGGVLTVQSKIAVDNIELDGNAITTTTGDLDIITGSTGVFKFNSNAFFAGTDASNQLEIGHGGSHAFINNEGAGNTELRWNGITKAQFTDFGHLHLLTDVDEKHTIKFVTNNNANSTGWAFENSGGNFSHTVYRKDIGGSLSDLMFDIGNNANIDLLTTSFKIHGATADLGKVEFFEGVLVNGVFETVGPTAGNIGGFPSGNVMVRSELATEFTSSVITGHSSFNGNTQLWYLGSTSSSTDNIAFINRQVGNTSISVSIAGVATEGVRVNADATTTILSDLNVNGNITHQGEAFITKAETLLVNDNHMYLNNGYAGSTQQTGGLVVNHGNDALATLISSGAFIAGVASTSNPTVVTTGSNIFSVSELVQIDGSLENDGLYEVLSHVGTLLTIRGIGTTTIIEDFTQNQFTSNASDSATITRVNISVNRMSIGGLPETAKGSSTGFTFNNLAIENTSVSFLNLVSTGEIQFSAFPNTRDDGTPLNILGTDVDGNLISGPNEVIHIGGNFTDTIDQAIVTASTFQDVTFNQNRLINNIGHVIGSAIFTINTDGVYNLEIAPQIGQGSGAATVEFQLLKNGTPIVDSGIQFTISANSQTLPYLRWKEKLFSAADTFTIQWASNSSNTSLDNITSLFGGANIPSIMLGVTHVGSIAA